jgi:hypothetical protein
VKLTTAANLSSEGPERDRVTMTHDVHRPWWYVWGPRSQTVSMTVGQAETLIVSLKQAVQHIEVKRRRYGRLIPFDGKER